MERGCRHSWSLRVSTRRQPVLRTAVLMESDGRERPLCGLSSRTGHPRRSWATRRSVRHDRKPRSESEFRVSSLPRPCSISDRIGRFKATLAGSRPFPGLLIPKSLHEQINERSYILGSHSSMYRKSLARPTPAAGIDDTGRHTYHHVKLER